MTAGRRYRNRRKAAAGCHEKKDKQRIWPQIVIRFDRETFDQVATIAARERISFAEQARRLVEIGLEELKC